MLRDKDRNKNKENKRSRRRKRTWEKRRKSGVFISVALILR
jgi:phosphoribosyl-AMP cyclohydrolase